MNRLAALPLYLLFRRFRLRTAAAVTAALAAALLRLPMRRCRSSRPTIHSEPFVIEQYFTHRAL